MILLSIAFVVASAVVAYTNEDVGIALGPKCTIGVTGTAATLTVQGWQAADACNTFDPGQSLGLYRYAGSVTTPTICQFRMERLLFTVNDEGALKLVGNVLCAALRSRPSPKRQLS